MDIKTLLVIGIAILLAAFMAMLVVLRTRKTYPGFGWWSLGLACEVLGAAFYLLRPQAPSWSTGLLTSGLFIVSLVFISRGMLVFRARKFSFRLEVGLLLSYLVLYGFFSVIYADANARIAVYSLYLGVGSLLTVYWSLSERPTYFGSSDMVLAASLLIQGLAAIARAVYSVSFQPDVVSYMLNSDFQGYFLVIQVVTAMLLPLAFISMNAQRIESDYRATQDALQTSLEQSERQRAQMVAFNEMNERLMACRHLYDAKEIIADSLQKLFGAGRANYFEYGEAANPQVAAAHTDNSFHFPIHMNDRPLGVLQVRVDAALPSHEVVAMKTFAARVSESIKLALSHLELEDELRTQALRDALTGLFNRRYLDDVLARELERCRRQGKTLTVAMLDLDHFKRVNDTFGHEAGDAVLRSLGQLLLHWSRASDLACRYGGEEFTLILQGSTPDDLSERLEDLLLRVAQMQIEHEGRLLPPITVSIGVAQATPDVPNATELLSRADGALYQAKQQGRNRVVVAMA
ncbi:MAG: diguanylate cyclase [Burkholderiaceae bacterium]|nr:diguanylate cyclase [Burkholderiaceae bacterium]